MQHIVNIVNLPSRTDRLESIKQEFANREEFSINIVSPIYHKSPRRSLWITLCSLVEKAMENSELEYFIFCEDDHVFTEDYNTQSFNQTIIKALKMQADILLGGASWIKYPYQISDDIFHIHSFTGLQFTVIFRRFFLQILQAEFSDKDVADKLISSLSEFKYLTYPTISSQKEFGYSDVTPMNNRKGRVAHLFEKARNILLRQSQIRNYYFKNSTKLPGKGISLSDISIPVYVINNDSEGSLEATLQQFIGKDEFEVTIIDHCIQNLWEGLVKCVEKAIDDNEDFFILFRKGQVFTSHYNRQEFLKNLIDAYVQRADILVGGLNISGHCYPISQNRYWVESFVDGSCIVIFKNIYSNLLSYIDNGSEPIYKILSKLSVNKMALFPFVSYDKENIKDTLQNDRYLQAMKKTEKEFDKFKHYAMMYNKSNT